MWSLSLMIDSPSMFSNQRGKIANVLVVRPTKTRAIDEMHAISNMGTPILGWQLFDEAGHAYESDNAGMCLNWSSREFDSIDVSYYNRY